MQARQMLLDGEILPSSWQQVARFIALISQAEGVKYSHDLISHQNYIHNLSLRIQRIKSSDAWKTKPGRKTFLHELRLDNVNDKECENSHLEKFIFDNYVEHIMMPDEIENNNSSDEMPDDFFLLITREHQKIHAMTNASAKYWLLEEIATLKKFGEEIFDGTLISETNSHTTVSQPRNESIQIAVSPQGLNVRKSGNAEAFSIPFSAVESAKSLRRCFHLCYLDEDFIVSHIVVKFPSHRVAGTLYRSLTEKHAFYSCETVHKNVETQFIRDLKVIG